MDINREIIFGSSDSVVSHRITNMEKVRPREEKAERLKKEAENLKQQK